MNFLVMVQEYIQRCHRIGTISDDVRSFSKNMNWELTQRLSGSRSRRGWARGSTANRQRGAMDATVFDLSDSNSLPLRHAALAGACARVAGAERVVAVPSDRRRARRSARPRRFLLRAPP